MSAPDLWSTIAFFASVIKAGEPWTPTCQAALDAAMAGRSPSPVVPAVLKSKKTLAQEYAEFAAGIIPKDAPQVQRVETRRAFYAGASSMFYLMTGQLDPGAEPTDSDVAYVESLSQELAQYARDLSEGKA